jgi:hypothetical protein
VYVAIQGARILTYIGRTCVFAVRYAFSSLLQELGYIGVLMLNDLRKARKEAFANSYRHEFVYQSSYAKSLDAHVLLLQNLGGCAMVTPASPYGVGNVGASTYHAHTAGF